MTLRSQYIYSLLMFVIKETDTFLNQIQMFIILVHYINSALHLPTAKLTISPKGDFYSGIKMYNHFPQSLKELSRDVRRFRLALKRIVLKTPSVLWRNIWVVNLMIEKFYILLTVHLDVMLVNSQLDALFSKCIYFYIICCTRWCIDTDWTSWWWALAARNM